MNRRRRKFPVVIASLLLSAGAFSLVFAATTSGRTPAQTERTQQRIDALLKQRVKPGPLPVVLPNPFQVVTGSATRSEGDAAPEGEAANPAAPVIAPPAEDSSPDGSKEALARYAAKLKIGGLIRINGQPQLIINDSPRKEGDFIIVEHKDAVTYLQIVKIVPGAVTIRLNEAVQTIKF